MIWGRIKSYALLALSSLVAVLGFLLTIFGSRSKRLKQQAETYKAKAHHAKTVMEKDVEIEREHDERTEKLADEIKRRKSSSELERPNEW